jgi:hypothetical protein
MAYREATITKGLTLSLSDWNNTSINAQYPVPGFELKLTEGTWIVYLSVVVQPNAAARYEQEPIWGRFRFNYFKDGSYYDPEENLGEVRRIGALNVSDRVYANVTKNVIKGYLVLEVFDQ